MIPMNGDAIYYDDHHLHDDDDRVVVNLFLYLMISGRGMAPPTHAHKHRYIEKLPKKYVQRFLRGIVFHFYV